jgi:peroxiredoxin family protein
MDVVNKKKVNSLKIASVGNPSLPMPNILGVIPGMTAIATKMMKGKTKAKKIPTIVELINSAKDMDVHLHACSTTTELMGVNKDDLIGEVEDVKGEWRWLLDHYFGETSKLIEREKIEAVARMA